MLKRKTKTQVHNFLFFIKLWSFFWFVWKSQLFSITFNLSLWAFGDHEEFKGEWAFAFFRKLDPKKCKTNKTSSNHNLLIFLKRKFQRELWNLRSVRRHHSASRISTLMAVAATTTNLTALLLPRPQFHHFTSFSFITPYFTTVGLSHFNLANNHPSNRQILPLVKATQGSLGMFRSPHILSLFSFPISNMLLFFFSL